MQVLTHDKIEETINNCERSACRGLQFYARPTSNKWFVKACQVTMKLDPFDAT